MRTAVVGHVEWVELVRVEHVPDAGHIVHGELAWQGPGGGGSDAAVQLAKLSDEAPLFTALGDDDMGRRSMNELARLGVIVHAAWRAEPTRRAFTHVDPAGERTITVIGDRLGARGDDPLPWDELGTVDATYFTAGDEAALRHARASRVLVATSRALETVRAAGIKLDALVGSGNDPDEAYERGSLDPAPDLVVMTSGASGGLWWTAEDDEMTFPAAPLNGLVVDRYGAGDSFAAGLTFALGTGATPEDAVAFASRCGTAVLRGTGPFETQLSEHPF